MKQPGGLYFDKRRSRWYYRWSEKGRRIIVALGELKDLPNRKAALKAADAAMLARNPTPAGPTVSALIQRYRNEKMPQRYSTSRAYLTWLKNYIEPQWGASSIEDVKPHLVDRWLCELDLAPKSKVHIRGIVSLLFDAAMFWELLPFGRNPMELVSVKGASKRMKEPRVLTVNEFRALLDCMPEPYAKMAVVATCLGLRFSELIALQWQDVNWLEHRIRIQRAMVVQREDEVKTVNSYKPMPLDPALIAVLETHHAVQEFNGSSDWLWGSPARAFCKPYSYTQCRGILLAAAQTAGLSGVGWHSLRHTYRSWLNVTGAAVAVQQKLMRHADIRTTMNVYGDTLPEELREAHGKVVKLVLT